MPYQSSPPSARGRKSSSRGSKILRIVSCVVAIILAAGIISMTARIIEILESTKDARLMWPYGMMLKAWPPGGMLAVSTYLMLVASSMAVVVNSVLLMMLCIRVSPIFLL
jgi:TRAP-type C4-dicarboxylate transport system permease small subunit